MKKEGPIFINREISWLSFNERVLQEAEDPNVPLIERVKFLGIFSNNRDEFFRVRVATVKRLTKVDKKATELMGESPLALLESIQQKVIAQQKRFDAIYLRLIVELRRNNIFIIDERQLNKEQQGYVREFFHDQVMPSLVPIMLDNHIHFPYLKDKSIYLIIRLHRKEKKPKHALIEIPTDVHSRFVVLPSQGQKKYVILLDDVIRFCLNDIFALFHHTRIEAYSIKLTRDAELDIDNDVSRSFIEKLSRSLKKRDKGWPVRLVYDKAIPSDMLDMLMRRIHLGKEENPIPGGRYHNFKDFIKFPKLDAEDLVYQYPHALSHPALRRVRSIFSVLRTKDVLLVYPYQSFYHIIDLLREASIDPRVQSIHITLYRVATNSNVVNALINAIKNGKSVTAVVELQARFDEEANIYWASKLAEEGAEVIYGVPGLKVHSKLFLITRREEGKLAYYTHVGTGNFNENTARVYSDFSLLTADRRIAREVKGMFDFYSNNLHSGNHKHLLAAPFSMRKKLLKYIHQEMENAAKGKQAYMILKLNSLVDEEMIRTLYKASQQGVRIRLIIRGICCLVPGVKGMSENIEAISIVDKYLEHGRIFIFCNGGDEKYFLSSADWMKRNLDHRSEVAVPVYDPEVRKIIRRIIDIQWNDNVKTRIINPRQDNVHRARLHGEKEQRSQDAIYEYLRRLVSKPENKDHATA